MSNYDYNNLNVGSLDYGTIKSNLIAFFKRYPQLQNFDFDNSTSSISLFLDILASNTAYNGYYLHAVLTNAFPMSATSKKAMMMNASLYGAFIENTLSARCVATLKNSGTTEVPEFSTFLGSRTNGSPCFFYNIEPIPATQGDDTVAINMIAGKGVKGFSEFDTEKLYLEVPLNYDPSAILFLNRELVGSTYLDVAWTQVTSFSNQQIEGINGKAFTVINGKDGYYVTTNIPGAALPSNNVTVKAIDSDGSLSNSAVIRSSRDYSSVTVVSHTVPTGGRDEISRDYVRSYVPYSSNTKDRLVTQSDYIDGVYQYILSKGVTNIAKTAISVTSPDVGQIKIYVTGLSSTLQEDLMVNYLATRKMAGISVTYGQ
jgi:hypothetical protein